MRTPRRVKSLWLEATRRDMNHKAVKHQEGMTSNQRVDLLNRVARWCYDQTESWQGHSIGMGLAYLFWAIAANDGQPFDTTIYPEQYAELIKILKSNPNGLWDELVAIGAIA